MNKKEIMDNLNKEAMGSHECPLEESRTQLVFGEGNPDADIMIVGQGPGVEEDRIGRPFVGPAGEMLERALEEIGLKREEVWITNIIKCRATRLQGGRVVDRAPYVKEKKACRPILNAEIEIVQPNVIVCLGAEAAKELIDKDFKITEERGKWHEGSGGIKTIATFHPAYVLRLLSIDRKEWQKVWDEILRDLAEAAKAAK